MDADWDTFVQTKLEELHKGDALPSYFGCISNLLTGKPPMPQKPKKKDNDNQNLENSYKNQRNKQPQRFQNYYSNSDDQENEEPKPKEDKKEKQPFKSPRGMLNSPLPRKQEQNNHTHDSDAEWFTKDYAADNRKGINDQKPTEKSWEAQSSNPSSPVKARSINNQENSFNKDKEQWEDNQETENNESPKKSSKRQVRDYNGNDSDKSWEEYPAQKANQQSKVITDEQNSDNESWKEYPANNNKQTVKVEEQDDSDDSWGSYTRKEEPQAKKPPPQLSDSDQEESSSYVPIKKSKSSRSDEPPPESKQNQDSDSEDSSVFIPPKKSKDSTSQKSGSNGNDDNFNYALAFREIGDAVFGKYWVPIEDTAIPRLNLDSKLWTTFKVKRFEKFCKQLSDYSKGNSLTYARRADADADENGFAN
ncbi:hypothetical protein TVAG_401960 [Trichomonas vaginalis G3]|uniref:Uncharacterized protein n=1 Tax=Trichomonas vaginalis (strain ATCC PRA-98 / G3) TaxID=412133 RepID=A2DHV3_TRIV3|nr:hypothetical protein TVAGG3_0271450 [Trichomonas vaginalis G3]EAY19942.1 hypothetical protein TVAG_401960 [Trichomonas vaginalis G3]KAI5525892.1 hypothetical protein TVAGG3_0271450 [Trichomonas vaginalis G3]|eukprot:XP_001580928.1 hypothetical protein [Trichomonas vaginalis G3]